MGLIGTMRSSSEERSRILIEMRYKQCWETLVIAPFESEKDYYSHTTVLVGLPEGQNCDLLTGPRPKCVIGCRTATIESVTDAFHNLKEDEHYILLDDILALPKYNNLRQLLYHCVKESVFRADRLIILIFRFKDEFKDKLWSPEELKDLLCDEFPCVHISEDRKGDKDVFYGNYYNRTFVPDDKEVLKRMDKLWSSK